ncbi:pyruvate, water dikinase regulatory protein [Polynucleobacter paneuropaeus]|jgi:regulator of PEP synthase PpsR (kinase-PPPase family)|uniref:Putative phosphoenolpyruvate synthase regulatory protein n=1 Tax=Polynucleobacter paneuropaeus TaxID=2527775 RepID=A0A2Z4JT68_9BURK|nr:pyruvate, water dikinase regulatory protein [Polynucleobacter paneuropaeus]AWW44285.1 phosphoenolpyruvate synthase regulatory protein [Polynucleobacter paneuropaeus]AWW45895.1 phosphoenolpyruvate synthase regulatory protein [Polynucleobacter paneuropaeus]AWW47738.1 phosphoenolpyruvate synthase regulatory protein [Polynucleobacter paneuropaeus]AWW49987.1 phosphoenolpyruvate synthase regulatory protein [Polynucleobacter paneuropaeus]MBT8514036.1 kinase/pyrophosphorylase [Polynucleobacter pane
MSNESRIVFIVSDGTGITAENFSQSILAQFEATFRQIRIPFVDTSEKAHDAVSNINQAASKYGVQPIVFTTLVNPELNSIVGKANGLILDMFQTFVAPLEHALGIKSTHAMNRLHHNADTAAYKNRIEAINYSLAHDDGQSNLKLTEADVILVGISRVGKTPTSLYLAMQYGLKAANYPLIPEDFERGQLPKDLLPYRQKIFGLMIDAERLSEIRNERRPGSNYAKLENCRYEINEATAMLKKESIPWVSTTSKSIEEIATTVLQAIKADKTILG